MVLASVLPPRSVVAAMVVAVAVLAPRAAAAQREGVGGRYAMVGQGASGEDQYAVQHRQWLDSMVKILRDKIGYDDAHLTILAETPGRGEERSTAEGVRVALARLAKELKATDQLCVLLIGHGAGEGPDAKFNLVGPDLSAAEWNSLLKPIAARLVFIDTTSSSFPYLSGLASPGRVVITATSSQAQHYHTIFMDAFIQAFSSDAADLDKNGRISMWEAFTYASRLVAQYYDQKGQLATEHAVLDDTGEGAGRMAGGAGAGAGTPGGQAGTLAGLTYLDGLPETKSADPEVQALIQRRDLLTEQVDDLRRHRQMMPSADFDQAFEKLIIDLATVSREVRRRTGR